MSKGDVTENTVSYPEGWEPDDNRPKTYEDYRWAIGKQPDPKTDGKPLVVLLKNPHAARDDVADKTVRKVVEIAKREKYNGWYVVNVCPERSLRPSDLKEGQHPEWISENVKQIEALLDEFEISEIWGAWGTADNPRIIECREPVIDMLRRRGTRIFHRGELTKDSQPQHLLYLPYDAQVHEYRHHESEPVEGQLVWAQSLRDKKALKDIPNVPGWYRWWAPLDVVKQLLNSPFISGTYLEQLTPYLTERVVDGDPYYCVYVGIAKSLRSRLHWHVNQNHTEKAVETGYLSTLRQSVSSLVAGNQFEKDETNRIIDQMLIEYYSLPKSVKMDAAEELLEKTELSEIQNMTLPLNILDNNNKNLTEFTAELRKVRKSSKLKEFAPPRLKNVVLIACSKTKLCSEVPARELYQGASFKKSLQLAERHFDDIFVLSAKYGVLPLDQEIAPYERTLKDMTKTEQTAWGRGVIKKLGKLYDFETTNFVILAGKRYYELLVDHLPHYELPLRGLPQGRRLKRLNELLDNDGWSSEEPVSNDDSVSETLEGCSHNSFRGRSSSYIFTGTTRGFQTLVAGKLSEPKISECERKCFYGILWISL